MTNKVLTKEEFCKLTGSPTDCWIFRGMGKDSAFYIFNDRIYFSNGVDTVWQFQDIPERGEILVSHAGLNEGNNWTEWIPWHVY